ncbi:MAG: peptidoglycan DD-metalloendopeptidase family protein [Kovacikia sp.]
MQGYGNVIYPSHPDGWETRYAYLSVMEVRPGMQVRQGQEKANYPIRWLCQKLKVSRSGFYRQVSHPLSDSAQHPTDAG